MKSYMGAFASFEAFAFKCADSHLNPSLLTISMKKLSHNFSCIVMVMWSVFVLLVGDGSQLLRWCGLSLCCWQGMAASCYVGVVCLCVAGRRWQPAVTVVWSVFVLLVGDGSQLLRWCVLSLCCW